MTTLADVGSQYSPTELDDALRSGHREVRFRYEILTREYDSRGYLQGVVPGGTISYDYLAEVKRTCAFTVREQPSIELAAGEIDWSSIGANDMLKPYFQLLMPDGRWASWPLGLFLIDAGRRQAKASDGVYRAIAGYDLGITLNRDLTKPGDFLAAGALATGMLEIILLEAGITKYLIPASAATLPTARSWDIGTKLTEVVNDLADKIAYGSIFFDADGVAVLRPYILPSDRPVEVFYADDERSVISADADESIDLWGVPNRWIVTVSQPDRAMLTSKFENVSATSPTSISNRGYAVTRYVADDDSADQVALDLKAKRLAHEDSQVYREFSFSTALMPMHGESNTLGLTLDSLGLDKEKYFETSWAMTLQEGALMTHTARKVVDVDALPI